MNVLNLIVASRILFYIFRATVITDVTDHWIIIDSVVDYFNVIEYDKNKFR